MEEKGWYVVHTQTGYEDKIQRLITQNSQNQGFADRIFQVLIPTEEVVEVFYKVFNPGEVEGKIKVEN